MSNGWIVLSIILFFAGILIWAWIADEKAAIADQRYYEAVLAAWLLDQEKLPKYKVCVLTKSGIRYTTESFEATGRVWRCGILGWIVDKDSSYEKAQLHICKQINCGRYRHADIYIPLCEVESMEIVR